MPERTESQHSEASPQHTPGPWHIEQADPNLPLYVVSDVTGIVICDLVGPPDRTEANANLITAAPKMLTMLMYVSACVERTDAAGVLVLHLSRSGVEALDSLIAEALGRDAQ